MPVLIDFQRFLSSKLDKQKTTCADKTKETGSEKNLEFDMVM